MQQPFLDMDEITQKLVDLATFQNLYDQARRALQHANSEEQARKHSWLMKEAEREYIALSDWLSDHDLIVRWDREKQRME